MKRVGICGNFSLGKDTSNGQIVKTRIIAQEIKRIIGEEQVLILDTYNWRENPIKLFLGCLRLILSCKNVLILPAQNGIRVLAPLFAWLNLIHKRSLHYSVIGGWLPEFLSNNLKLLNTIGKMDMVYVETNTMKDKLHRLGLENVVYMPNFKNIKVVQASELPANYDEPYKLCTFSRVKKEKGILDAIEAVKETNKAIGRCFFRLDIYGVIELEFQSEFEEALSRSADCVEYKGTIPYDQSTATLKQYFALLFPTYYEGEGFPGTIIDAFSAGLPVIATNWRYNSELVDVGKTGLIYDLNEDGKEKGLINTLMKIHKHPQEVVSMKTNCLKEALEFNPNIVMQKMICKLG